MSDPITATELRSRIYRVLDAVLETGEPQAVVRKGQRLLIIPAHAKKRFGEGPRLDVTDSSIDELAAVSWEDAWSGS